MPDDKSKLLENLVYTELRRRYSEDFYFFKNKYETDFYIPKTEELIQVSYTLYEQKTREREIKSLKHSMLQLETVSGLILTYDDAEEKVVDKEVVIIILPIWKWLLEK